MAATFWTALGVVVIAAGVGPGTNFPGFCLCLLAGIALLLLAETWRQ